MIIRYTKHLFIHGSMFLLVGCAQHKSLTLQSFKQDLNIHSFQEPNVHISWKFFDREDCNTSFGRNILSKRLVPVQIRIRNNSNDLMYVSSENFSISLVSPDTKMHSPNDGEIIAWGIGGIITWPLLIPTTYDDEIASHKASSFLHTDYQSKTFKKHTIQPYKTLERIIFFPKEKIHQSIKTFLINRNPHSKS